MPNNVNAFVPEVWSQKLAVVEKKLTNFLNNMCNREWEGEIKSFGDVVRISLPDPDNIVIGEGIVADTSSVTPTQKTLVINKSKNFAFKFNDIEQAQSQFNMIEGYLNTAMQKTQDVICLEVQNAIFADSNVETFGTTGSPKALTASTVYDFVVDLKIKLTAKGVLNAEGYYIFKGNKEDAKQLMPMLTVSPEIYGAFLKSTHLTHPTVAGDDLLKSGQRKQIAGFEIIPDTQISNVTGATASLFPYIAGTKMGVTFANQFEKVEKLRDLDSFADIVRGLQLYGFETIHAKSLLKGYCTIS